MAGSTSWCNSEVARDATVAVATVVLAAAVSIGLEIQLGTSPQASALLCAIMFVAWARGISAAVLAAVLAMLSFSFIVLKPAYSLQADFAAVVRIAFFGTAAAFVVLLSAAYRRAEQALRSSEAKLITAIDTIPVLLASYGPDGRRDFANAAWRSYTGLSHEQVRGTEQSAIMHPDDIPDGESVWHAALQTAKPLHVEQRLRAADGTYRWFVVDRVPLRDEDGRVLKWFASGYDIEDRKRAESALRRSEAQLVEAERELRLTLDSIPSMAWQMRPDGHAEYFNKRWLDYTGFSLNQTLGWNWQSAIHPDDLERVLTKWRAALASGRASGVEARLRRRDGEYRWFFFRPEPLRDEAGKVIRWYGTNTDIEDRKRAETALQRSEAYLAEAQKITLTGSFGWSLTTNSIFWSDQAYNIMGYDRTVVPSVDLILARVHPDDRARVRNEIDVVLQGGQTLDFEHRLVMPDGEIKYLRVVGHRVQYVTGQEEMVGAVVDFTAAKRAQEALHAAQAELAHANRVTTLGEISASIAHEVNQPLAAIISNAQACLRFLGRESPDLNDVRGTIERIVNDGNRAGEVIQHVRALMNKSEPELLPLDINELVREVVVLLERELTARHVSLRLQLIHRSATVIADRTQLQQVVINLIMNGIEAMQATNRRELTVRSYEDDVDQATVAVIDSGVGFGAEDPDRLFQAFFSTKPDGLGIGLSICRSIIEGHGGRIWAVANAGPGASFQFALPVHRESRSAATERTAAVH